MSPERYDDLESLRQRVVSELGGITRYPMLIVLTNSRRDWESVTRELTALSDDTVHLSSFCLDEDTFPDTVAALNEIKRHRKHTVLVTPLGELLRVSREAPLLDALGELEWQDTSRIIVPMCQAWEILQGTPLARRDRWVRGELAPVLELVTTDQTEPDTLILTSVPPPHDRNMRMCSGMRSYLKTWEAGNPGSKICLETGWTKLFTNVTGGVWIRKFESSFDWLGSTIRGMDQAQQKWGDEARWRFLLDHCTQGEEELTSVCSRIVGLPGPDTAALSRMLCHRPEEVRWVGWVWLKIDQAHRGEGYLSLVMDHSEEMGDVTRVARKIAAERDMTPDELRVLVDLENIWPCAESIVVGGLSPLRILGSVSATSDGTKSRLVRALGDVVSTGPSAFEQGLRLLEVSYPQLASYPTSMGVSDKRLETYFQQYRACRLSDRPTTELLDNVEKASKEKWCWEYRPRDAVVEEVQRTDSFHQFWIDGLGMEWVPCLINSFGSQAEPTAVETEVHVARASLPSNTETNGDWSSQTDVDHRLDRLAHAYDYTFPGSFVKQASAVYELSGEILRKVREAGEPMLVVGDHGLTRFAGRAGLQSMDCPAGADSRNGPRFAVAPPDHQDSDAWAYSNGMIFSSTYADFRVAGARTGETHGGATLEEILVPVIVFRIARGILTTTVEVTILSRPVHLDFVGHGQLVFRSQGLRPPISIVIQGQTIPATSDEDNLHAELVGMQAGTWSVVFVDAVGCRKAESVVLVKGASRNALDF